MRKFVKDKLLLVAVQEVVTFILYLVMNLKTQKIFFFVPNQDIFSL